MPVSFGKLILIHVGNGERKQEFSLAKPVVALGRAATSDIVLSDAKASRQQARLDCSAEGCSLVDLHSLNGTRVNGVRTERAQLAPGDVITVGDTDLRYEVALPVDELDVTVIDSAGDLEKTLADDSLAVTLSETRLPRLAVHTPSRTWEMPFAGETLTIGRSHDSDIPLEFPQVSRHHARLERHGEVITIQDLKSVNGTWVGAQRVEERTLRNGDVVRIGPAQLVYKGGFEAENLTAVEPPAAAAPPGRRPVVIVPGLMGSELWRGSERLWPNIKTLFSDPDVYRLSTPLEARALVGEVVIVPNIIKLEQYNRLGDYLEEGLNYQRGRDLLEFAYDWRQDVRLSAKRLAEAIDRWAVAAPVTIIAHSLGCLVSRYYVERLGGKDKVERLILVGGPHAGVPKAVTTLFFGPDLLPFGFLGERLREVVATFPSTYQILPNASCAVDQKMQQINVLVDESWIPESARPLLRLARDFRQELGTRSSVPTVSIFGYGLKTMTGATILRANDGRWQKLDLTTQLEGDSSVPETSAVLEGSEIHPVQQYHGALYVDADVKMRLKIELTRPQPLG